MWDEERFSEKFKDFFDENSDHRRMIIDRIKDITWLKFSFRCDAERFKFSFSSDAERLRYIENYLVIIIEELPEIISNIDEVKYILIHHIKVSDEVVGCRNKEEVISNALEMKIIPGTSCREYTWSLHDILADDYMNPITMEVSMSF